MKKKFMGFAMKVIKSNGNYSEEKLEEIAYGLEGLYLTFTKMIILFGLAIILGIVKEFILLLVFYNIIRTNAFGLHATKSIYCLITSVILFIGGALVCKYVTIPFEIILIITGICIMFLFKYAPADTHKRPLVNKKKRKRFKILSSLSGIVYLILIIIFKEHYIVNYLLLGLVEAVIMIHPLTYKIFNLPYNNYKKYESVV